MLHSATNVENFVLNLERRSKKLHWLTTTATRRCESERRYRGHCMRKTRDLTLSRKSWWTVFAVCIMTPSSSMHLDFHSFLAWQWIHFGDNPAGSKGFSHHPCHALQGKCNKGSTRRGHSLSATHYIPHSSVSSHSSVCLHSFVSSHSSASLHSPHTCRQLCMFTARRFAHCPCSMYLLQQWFPAQLISFLVK